MRSNSIHRPAALSFANWRVHAALGALLLLASIANGAATSDADIAPKPFQMLREAYAQGDARAAASAYTEQAVYGELYPGAAPRLVVGRANIALHFAAMFTTFPGGADLNFRIVSGNPDRDGPVAGYYRLRVGTDETAHLSYGSFVAVLSEARFTLDTSSSATREEFDAASGALLFADETAVAAPQ